MSVPTPQTSVNSPSSANPAPPTPVRIAFVVSLLAALVGLVFGAIYLVRSSSSSAWARAINDAGGPHSRAGIALHGTETTTRIIAVVFAGLFYLAWLLVAVKMRNGRSWARVVLTIAPALSLIGAVTTKPHPLRLDGRYYATPSNPPTSAYIGTVLGIVAIVLMYQTLSNRYFTTSKFARRT